MKKIQALLLIGVLVLGTVIWLLMNDEKVANSNTVTVEKSVGTEDRYEVLPFLESVVLTQMELDEVKRIQNVGTLNIATVPTEFNYSVQEDGTINGFNYYLALSFADALGVKLKVKEVVWDD